MAQTQAVRPDQLVSSVAVPGSLGAGRNLIVDALVTGSTGAFSQTVAFTIGAGAGAFEGQAAWG